MRAVLLFSALIHIAALGLLVAYALRSWLEARRPKEPSFVESVMAAGALGVVVMVATTVLMWLGRGFGSAILTGVIAGALAAVAFLLALGAWPRSQASFAGPPSRVSRVTAMAFVGVIVVTELVAFCFLAAAAGSMPHS